MTNTARNIRNRHAPGPLAATRLLGRIFGDYSPGRARNSRGQFVAGDQAVTRTRRTRTRDED